MALQGKFVINDADYSPLSFPGVEIFLAFSGDGVYRNRGACGTIQTLRVLRNVLLRTQLIDIPCMKKLKAYGSIEVIVNGNICP
ncbi:hypothetical protein [Ewingella americana]|uniref:Uncharacterized protein n=1 Tax=Ewingella americana TaxID=41202 RepID=A0A502GBZ4_9GAMM|nr:hypothetical protein [Ewingella americana]TPG59364.1 hypothetical protein EAH77_17275 [Ewingella americana]